VSDPFVILGVPRDATDDVIKVAYRKLARQYHPDLIRDRPEDERKVAEEKLKEINGAYEVLKDPTKRARAANINAGGQARYDFEFGNTGPGAGFRFEEGGDVFHNFNDLFRQHFREPPRRANNHIAAQAILTLEEAFSGKEIDIEIASPEGKRTIQVKVPAGVDDGSRLRIVGEGDKTIKEMPPGDLYVTIRIREHAIFQRVAQNLVLQQTLTVWDALLGHKIDIVTIDGRTIRVDLPAGTQDNDRLRIAGHGMPLLAAGHLRGDLVLVVKVVIPNNLSEAQKDLVRQARDWTAAPPAPPVDQA
jgi:curved DNA-binding protein